MPSIHYPAVMRVGAQVRVLTFPDLPGCRAEGATPHEAALSAEGALAVHLEELSRRGEAAPAPGALSGREGVNLLVRAEAPARVERVLISMDAGLLAAIDAVARNRSAWFAQAAREALSRAAAGPSRQRNDPS